MPVEREQIGACTLYRGDCFDVVPELGRSIVDIVITDPPFSVPVKYHDADGDFPRSWGDLAVMEPYFATWFTHLRQICRYDHQVYICCDATTYPVFYKAAMGRWTRSHMLVWYKPTGRRGTGWKHAYELVLHLSTVHTTYNPTFRQDVIGIMPVRTLERQHPAEKPGALCEFLLEASVPTHTTVLDTHMGSGTTGIAAVKCGKQFIGIEIERHFFDIACQRITDAYAQPDLFVSQPTRPAQQALFAGGR